jgi:hypothetical protein
LKSPDIPANLPSREALLHWETTSDQLVAIPITFQHFRIFVSRQESAVEFLEHVEEARLIAITGRAIRHLELHDHMTVMPDVLPLSRPAMSPQVCLKRGARIHGAFTSLSLI